MTALVSKWNGAAAREVVDGIDVRRTGSRNTFSVAAPAYCRRHLRSESFDAVIEDLNKVPLFTPLWCNAPLVLLVHHLFGATAFQEASLPFAAATWLLEKPLGKVYRNVPVEAVSESTARDLVGRGFARDRIVVIPNGVDLSFYRPDPAEPRFAEATALYLGRLKKYKRIDLILRAVRRLVDAGVPVRLLVAGKGDAQDRLLKLRAELGLEDVVDFRGYVTELEKLRLMRKCWVHVLTSPKEGWGISNLEAAACGTPTIASDSPGLRDSVVNGETGYLVPHGNVDALADRLRTVLRDPTLRDDLGDAASRFAAGFTWDAAADRTEAHLAQVLNPARAGRPERRIGVRDLETDHR